MTMEHSTWKASVDAYTNYIKGKGKYTQYGDPHILDNTKDTSQTSRILAQIKAGEKFSTLVDRFPTMVAAIKRLMGNRPARRHLTRCLYVWGPTKVGKSTAIKRVLNSVQELYGYSWHAKMLGFYEKWEGYDNQDFVMIDDPGLFDARYRNKEIVDFNNVIGPDAYTCDVKFGNFQFDSRLVIITANMSPGEMADSAGRVHRDAVLDRLAGTRAYRERAVEVPDSHYAREILPRYIAKCLCKIVKHYFDIAMDIELILDNRSPIDVLSDTSSD